jgi:hypothetical protein
MTFTGTTHKESDRGLARIAEKATAVAMGTTIVQATLFTNRKLATTKDVLLTHVIPLHTQKTN